MQQITMTLQAPLKRSEVFLGEELLFSEIVIEELRPLASRFAIFCDDTVTKIIGERWTTHLQKKLEAFLFSFPQGEKEKTQESKAQLEDLLLSQKFNRDTCIVAVGGGVTLDLIGFLAATFCRGVPLINVPTTLLGMVDAAIGGKTGVNTRFGKNLVGAFHPAKKVFIDPSVLRTLPEIEWTNGYAEAIKYALIHSDRLFESLKKWARRSSNRTLFTALDIHYLQNMIHECVLIKSQIVETDPEERLGLRRILNFGHTIGHAIEKIEHYDIAHGEAVAIGMLVESYLSVKMGLLTEDLFREIQSLVHSFPFRLRLSSRVTKEKVRDALSYDKKTKSHVPRFVLLAKIGACHPFHGHYCGEVPIDLLNEGLDWMIESFGEKHG